METYLQRLRRTNPEAFFDGRGRPLSDKEVVDKLLKDTPEELREETRVGFYMPYQEEAKPKETGVVAGVKQLAGDVLGGIARTPITESVREAYPTPQSQESMGDFVRRANPSIAKASDKGLARFLKTTYNIDGSLQDIEFKLANTPADSDADFRASIGLLPRIPKEEPKAPEQPETPKEKGLIEKVLPYTTIGAAASLYSPESRATFAKAAEDITSTARASVLESVMGAPVQALGAQLEMPFKTAEQFSRLAQAASLPPGSQINPLATGADAPKTTAALESIRNATGDIADPLFEEASYQRSRVTPQKAIPKFIKAVDGASGAMDVLSAIGSLGKDLLTTTEGLVLVADQAPTIFSALISRSPTVAAGTGSLAQRVGSALAELPPEERVKEVNSIIATQAPGAAIDAATAGLLAGLLPQQFKTMTGAVGGQLAAAGVEGAGGALAEYAVNPDATRGELLAEGVIEALVGRGTEAGPALLAQRLVDLPAKQAEKSRIEALVSSPDPLDKAEGVIADMALKAEEQPVTQQAQPEVQQQLDLLGDVTDQVDKSGQQAEGPSQEALRAQDIMERDRLAYADRSIDEMRKRQEIEKAYAERESQREEERLIERYDDALASGDLLAESKAEQALDEFYKRKVPAVEQPPARVDRGEPVQTEMEFTGAVQPESTVERAPASRESPQPATRKIAKRATNKYNQLATQQDYTPTPMEVSTVERYAQDQGLPPLKKGEALRNQFNKLTPEAQSAAIRDITGSPLIRESRKASKPTSSPVPTPVAPAVVETATETPRAPPPKSPDAELMAKLKALPKNAVKTETMRLIREEGLSPYRAFEKAVNTARSSGGVLGQVAPLAREYLSMPAESSTRLELSPQPADSASTDFVNDARAKGWKVQSASNPQTGDSVKAETMAKALGYEVEWYTPEQDADVSPRGMYKTRFPKKIGLNTSIDKSHVVVAGHEINHGLERNPAYRDAVTKALLSVADKPGLSAAMAEKLRSKYAPGIVAEEVRSDILGELLQERTFLNEMRTALGNKPGTFERFVDWVKDILDRIIGKINRSPSKTPTVDQVLTDVKAYKRAVIEAARAVRESKTAESGTPSSTEGQQRPGDANTLSDLPDAYYDIFPEKVKSEVKDAVTAMYNGIRDLTSRQGRADEATSRATLRDAANRTSMGREHELMERKLSRAARKARATPEEVDRMLRGELEPPPLMKDAVTEARNEIDRQTMVLISLGIDPKTEATLRARLGKYLSKSYQAWDNPKQWKRTVMSRRASNGKVLWDFALDNILAGLVIPADLEAMRGPAIKRLAQYWDVGATTKPGRIAELRTIRDNLKPEDMLARAEYLRNQLVNPRDYQSPFINGLKTAMQGANNILKKVDTPEWVREVWGEIKDGSYNFLATAERQAALISKFTTLDRLAADLLEKGKASYKASPGMRRVPVSEAWGPLSGMYVKEEDLAFIEQIRSLDKAQEYIDAILTYSLIGPTNAIAKVNNVVYDQSSVSVQAISSIVLAPIVTGRPPMLGELKRALENAISDVAYSLRTEEQRARVRESIELGVASEGVWSREARQAIRQVLLNERDQDAMKGTPKDVNIALSPQKLASGMVEKLKSAGMTFAKIIQFGDTFSRSLVYEIELTRAKEFYPELSLQEQKEMAAEKVQNLLPTMSKTAPIAKIVGKSGFINAFAPFVWEVHRNSAHSALYGIADLKGNTLAQKRVGVQRLAAATATLYGLGTLIWSPIGYSVADAIREAADEEGEKLTPIPVEWMPHLVPDYHENNAGLVPVGINKDGVLMYLNPQRFNAYEPMWQLLKHLTNEDPESAVRAWTDTVYPGGFIEGLIKSTLAGSVDKAIGEHYLANRHFSDAYSQLEKIFIPGFWRRAVDKPIRKERAGDPMTTIEQALENTGMTVHYSAVLSGARRALRDWQSRTLDARSDVKNAGKLSTTVFDNLRATALGDELTQEDVDRIYADWYATNLEIFQEASTKLNVYDKVLSNTNTTLSDVAKEVAVSQDNLRRLLSGNFQMPKLVTDGSKRDFFATQMKAEMERANEENKQAVRDKWNNIKRMFLAAERDFKTQKDDRND